ncbi:MAG: TolC family outer membrane protein, partial [Burkholderiales bacterium]
MSQAFTRRRLGGAVLITVMGCAGQAYAATLEEAVARAVATFPEIQTGAANRRAAIAAISEARAGYFPAIDTTLGYGRQRSDNVNTQGGAVTINPREARVSITQLVYDGGAVSSQVRLQESRSESRAYDLANTAQTTALRAARAYLEVLRLRSVIKIAQANVAVHQQTLRQVTLLTEGGAARRSDVQQAVARLALAQSSLTSLRGQLEQAESDYRRLIGLPPPLQMENPTVPLERLPRSEQTALAQALDAHPALKASNAELAAARADLQVSRTRYIPQVNIELSASQNENVGGVSGTESDRIAALRLHYNIFRGGADRAHISQSEAQVDRADADVANLRNDLEREVRVAWEALAADREQLTYLQTHAEVSAEVVEAYRAQF